MKKSNVVISLVVLVVLIGLGTWAYYHVNFSFANFRSQLALADWRKIGIGLAAIYLGYVFRGVRWALLIRHNKKVGPFALLGTQVIGFTAVALIGRVADLTRPYLTSKKTELPLSSQIAVYIVERLFDMGSLALLFSVAAMWIPQAEILKVMSHTKAMSTLAAHSPALTAFAARFGVLVLTVLGASFMVIVRMSGEVVASFFESSLGLVSKKLGHAVADKIRVFRSGLDTIRSLGDFATAASLSLLMWFLIAVSYFETCHAFAAMAGLTPPKCALLMVASGGASIFQLPVLGWFTQIGVVAWAISAIVGASAEASTAAAAMLLVVTFLGVVPIGLIWAQFEHVSLRKVAAESEQAAVVEEEAAAEVPVENPS